MYWVFKSQFYFFIAYCRNFLVLNELVDLLAQLFKGFYVDVLHHDLISTPTYVFESLKAVLLYQDDYLSQLLLGDLF